MPPSLSPSFSPSLCPSPLASRYAALFDLIQERLALVPDAHRCLDIAHVVEELRVTEGFSDIQTLVLMLSEQPTTTPLWQKLIRIVTIGETYFFRDQNQLNALRLTVLPDLIAQRRREGRLQLRLWSAGCSTGEEPYTLAILLRELLPDIRAWDITILATDLNLGNIECARSGIYRPWSFRDEMLERIRKCWFVEVPGGYQLDRSIREMVTFAPLNLANDDYPSLINATVEMDVILCRNVLIYFDNPTAAAVIARFHRALSQSGWLILGHSESAHIMGQPFKPAMFENAVLFQKRLPEESKSQRSAESSPGAPTERIELRAPVMVDTALLPVPEVCLTSPVFQSASPTGRLGLNASDVPQPPPQPDPWGQARQAADKEQWPAALYWLAEAEKKEKMRPEIHYLRGLVQLQQEEVEKALASLRRAIYCDSNFVLAHFALGEIYEKQGHYKKASYQWNQAQAILGLLPPEEIIAFNDDLTVEMLSRLLLFRLDNLAVKGQGNHHDAS